MPWPRTGSWYIWSIYLVHMGWGRSWAKRYKLGEETLNWSVLPLRRVNMSESEVKSVVTCWIIIRWSQGEDAHLSTFGAVLKLFISPFRALCCLISSFLFLFIPVGYFFTQILSGARTLKGSHWSKTQTKHDSTPMSEIPHSKPFYNILCKQHVKRWGIRSNDGLRASLMLRISQMKGQPKAGRVTHS